MYSSSTPSSTTLAVVLGDYSAYCTVGVRTVVVLVLATVVEHYTSSRTATSSTVPPDSDTSRQEIGCAPFFTSTVLEVANHQNRVIEYHLEIAAAASLFKELLLVIE